MMFGIYYNDIVIFMYFLGNIRIDSLQYYKLSISQTISFIIVVE